MSRSIAEVAKSRDVQAAKRRKILAGTPPKADAAPGNQDDLGGPNDWEDFPGIADALAAITNEGTDSTITVDLSLGAFITSRCVQTFTD
ncbi:hypothetical protein AURDEDRAFT_164958 [Auricularia subglabra TFB-10046 SS5]|nr:hypothetical protein AURDEDRAFT_164958 [Auricularia subglabra TFB-10046 SS5]